MPIVRFDGRELTDWEAFHDVFAERLGFPDFYGRNMNAWIDCMASIDTPDHGMTSVFGTATDPVVLHVDSAGHMPDEIVVALLDCAAFVNYQRLDQGESSILMVSLWRKEP